MIRAAIAAAIAVFATAAQPEIRDPRHEATHCGSREATLSVLPAAAGPGTAVSLYDGRRESWLASGVTLADVENAG